MRVLVFLISLTVCAGALAQGIDPSELRVASASYRPLPAAILRTETNRVEIGAVVRDTRGHAVSGLQKGDFQIFDGGSKRTIASFSVFTSYGGATGPPPSSASEAAPAARSTPGQRAPDRTALRRFLGGRVRTAELLR